MSLGNFGRIILLAACLCLSIFMLAGCDKMMAPQNQHVHTFEEYEGQEPTCEIDGWRPYQICSVCKYSTFSKIPALGHDYPEQYQANGEVHTISCSRCAVVFDEGEHNWQIAEVIKEPTCLTDGSAGFVCDTCSAEKVMTLSALGHDLPDEYETNTDEHTLICSRCEVSVDTGIHDWQSFGVTAKPTCTREGAELFACSVCHIEKTEPIALLGHLDDDVIAGKDPTCTEMGLTQAVRCSRCNVYTTPHTAIPPKGHSVVTDDGVAPTCTESGISVGKRCVICLETLVEQEVLEPLGHNYKKFYEPNGDVHSRFCTRCSATTDDKEHTWAFSEYITEPGCTAEGTQLMSCTVCRAEKTEVANPIGHEFKDYYEQNGDVHSRFCTRCTAFTDDKEHTWAFVRVEKEPDCTNLGQNLLRCSVCSAERTELVPFAHAESEWVTILDPTALTAGTKVLRCSSCKEVFETESIPADVESMPRVYLEGDYLSATAAKNEVSMTVEYIDPTRGSFTSYATIKVQGSSSASYDKKNYTIKFFTDAKHDSKYKVDFGWGKESKYVMKANWVDFSQARNVVSCRLWGNMIKTRAASANQLRLAALKTNGGAIDGYPVAVYMNGVFHGIYTMNVPKDEWMFGMGEKDENDQKSKTEALIAADDWNHTDFYSYIEEFVEDSSGDIYSKNNGWELRYYGGNDYAWVAESFDALIRFCHENDGEAFKAGISNHLDVDAAIDYIIFMYANAMRDNASKNMLWATYDGKTWIPSVYDQDGTFGQVWDGVRFMSASADLPSIKNGKVDVGINYGPSTNNTPKFILWDKIWNNFTEEILERYDELRGTVLSVENIRAELRAFETLIPESVFEADLERWQASRDKWWTGKGQTTAYDYTKYHYDYMYTWVEDRMRYYDNAMNSIRNYYGY